MPLLAAVGLAVILTAFVAYGMSFLQHSQNTGLLGWLASAVARIPLFGGASADQILKLDQWISHYIGSHFQAVESKAVGWISGMRQYVGYVATAAVAPAIAAYVFGQWLLSIALPKTIDARTSDIRAKAYAASAQAEAAMKAEVGLKRAAQPVTAVKEVPTIQRVAMPHAQEWDWINEHWAQLKTAVLNTATLPIHTVLPKVQPLAWPYGLTPTSIRRRFKRVEALLGVTAFAAVLAGVLGVTAKCVRPGGPLGKVARSLCGLPSGLLNDFLALLADVWVLENICVLIPLLEEAASVIAVPLVEALTDATAGLCKGSIGKPDPLVGPQAVVPPVIFTAALAGA